MRLLPLFRLDGLFKQPLKGHDAPDHGLRLGPLDSIQKIVQSEGVGHQIVHGDGLGSDQFQAMPEIVGRAGKGAGQGDLHVVQPTGIHADGFAGRRPAEDIEGAALAGQFQVGLDHLGNPQGGDHHRSPPTFG
ncbi:hypothetical protein DESC_770050 [Desulfosarcina cetonica]|nr:hypothetical protein DESC_770050 [Desulfosarcina cetonica]